MAEPRPALVKRPQPHPAEELSAEVPAPPTPPPPPKPTPDLVQFSVRVPAELRQRYRLIAIQEGRQVQELAREALEQYLEQRS